ncbi:FKBP-type peptidyl-prolyl cis-trans isomerase [uncultured archaeon]|nr:FKBP-type peptidyl-prolyl cis-trans isomerase [uncultured archaeon]
MKKIIAILGILAVAILLGCTQAPQNGSGLMGDTNKIDSNTSGNGYSNLDQFAQLVRVGNKVSVDYTGRFTDGNVFDSSAGKTPLQFTVGAHNVIAGFENAVVGMRVGDSKTVTIPPEQAYGQYDENKVLSFDANQFADFNQLVVGAYVTAWNTRGRIIEVTDKNAVIDFNPALAGKTLVFEIKLISID